MAKFFTLKEVSEMLHLNPITVSEKVKGGEIQAFKTGRKYLFSEEQINKFLENNKIA